jgi:hypothetical protein
MVPALPVIEPCRRCLQAREHRMRIQVSNEGQPPDKEIHYYLCRCGISALESLDGGPWTWRKQAEHCR